MKSITNSEVREFLLRHYGSALMERSLVPNNIPDNFDFLGEGIVDSLGILDMVSSVEREFGVQLDMEKIAPEELTILGPFCSFVAKNSKASPV